MFDVHLRLFPTRRVANVLGNREVCQGLVEQIGHPGLRVIDRLLTTAGSVRVRRHRRRHRRRFLPIRILHRRVQRSVRDVLYLRGKDDGRGQHQHGQDPRNTKGHRDDTASAFS